MTESIGPDEEIQLETLIERVKREGGEAIAAFKRRSFAPREKMDVWRDEVARGDRARSLLASDVWRKDLEPLLSGSARIRPCRPDALPEALERAAVEYLFKSGSSYQSESIERTLREWVAAGEKAAVLLRGETEKRKGAARG